MNIFQIAQIRNKQTINKNRFTLEFIGLDRLLRSAKVSPLPWIRERYEAVQAALGSSAEDIGISLQISLKTFTIPKVTLGNQEIHRFNDVIRAVTKFDAMEEMPVSFIDYVGGSASAIMQLWHAFVGDKKTGAIGFKEDFVLPRAFFYVYGPDAPGYNVVEGADPDPSKLEVAEVPWLQKYEIWNLFPTAVDLGEASSEDAEAREVSCTFIIDNFFPIGIRTYTGASTTSTNPLSRYSEVPATAIQGEI